MSAVNAEAQLAAAGARVSDTRAGGGRSMMEAVTEVAAAVAVTGTLVFPVTGVVVTGKVADVDVHGLREDGADTLDAYRTAAGYVDRILRGAKVSELPVQFPTKFELVVNLKAAKAIGLTIPEAFLLRADELIE